MTAQREPSVRLFAVIGAGGALGTLMRVGVGAVAGSSGAATLTVNLVGALALGFLVGWAPWQRRITGGAPVAQGFFGTGVLGGFTTYSALALEVVELPLWSGLGYGLLTVGAGVAVALAGMVAGRRIAR